MCAHIANSSLPNWTSVPDLPHAHGGPIGEGRIRGAPEDFQVEEILGFEPDGEGDHLLLWVRKTGANTEWVARKLAGLLEVPGSAVGFCGLKDRHAVTSQWFSVPRPRSGQPDWASLEPLGIEVLAEHLHRRKLKRGALEGNRFRILIRDFCPDPDALSPRLSRIRERGVPGYFGEQRFGQQEGNLTHAHQLLTGRGARVSRHTRGLWLSAARSQIFNELLAERVRRDDWDRAIPGDCLQLDGSRSHFVVDAPDPEIAGRIAAKDLHPTGPLWGAGELTTRGDARALEEAMAAPFLDWCQGLARAGLKQERRALRIAVGELEATRGEAGLVLTFALGSGAYATSVLRELARYTE